MDYPLCIHGRILEEFVVPSKTSDGIRNSGAIISLTMNENDAYKIRRIGIDRPILIQLHEALDFRQEKHAYESSTIFQLAHSIFHID